MHTTSFVALLFISIFNYDKSRSVNIWTDFGGDGTVDRGSYKLLLTLLPFPLITGFFHFVAASDFANYYGETLIKGVARMRWIEYMITNSLMSWSLVLLAGGGNIVLPILAVLFNVLMQAFGWYHEIHNHQSSGKGKAPVNKTWEYMVFGFVPWVANWFVVFFYFFERAGDARVADWLAIVGSFVLSFTFVLPLFWRYGKEATQENNYYTERAYLLLSLTAKLWLDWVVTIDTL